MFRHLYASPRIETLRSCTFIPRVNANAYEQPGEPRYYEDRYDLEHYA
jgi:hypothetical protein